MSYCAQSDLVGRFGEDELIQLTTNNQDLGAVIDSAVMDLAIQDADAEIDGYLATRYSLPLASMDANLTRIACDIARYRLYEDTATETVTDRYKAAVDFLKQVAAGKADLSIAVTVTDMPVISADAPVFSRRAWSTA